MELVARLQITCENTYMLLLQGIKIRYNLCIREFVLCRGIFFCAMAFVDTLSSSNYR